MLRRSRSTLAIGAARSVRDFDEHFIAPRHGFAGADDHYGRC